METEGEHGRFVALVQFRLLFVNVHAQTHMHASIQPARAALQPTPTRARSGERSGHSAGKSRSYKRTGKLSVTREPQKHCPDCLNVVAVTYGRGDQPEDDEDWTQQQQQQNQPQQQQQFSGADVDRAPDFATAAKKFRENGSGTIGSGGAPAGTYSNSNNNGNNNYSGRATGGGGGGGGGGGSGGGLGDRGSRQFNPSRSVVDAINNAGAGSAAGSGDSAKRKKYAPPSRPDDDKLRIRVWICIMRLCFCSLVVKH